MAGVWKTRKSGTGTGIRNPDAETETEPELEKSMNASSWEV